MGSVKILPCEFTSADKSLCAIVLKITAGIKMADTLSFICACRMVGSGTCGD